MDKYEAILKLYPNAAIIRGDIAYDINNNEVVYDKALVQAKINANSYIEKRQAEYPNFTDYLDGIVKGDNAQVQKYIDDCLAVKAKYPKTLEETE